MYKLDCESDLNLVEINRQERKIFLEIKKNSFETSIKSYKLDAMLEIGNKRIKKVVFKNKNEEGSQ